MSVTAFRVLLALSILIGVFAGVVDLASQPLLPPLLQLHWEGWQMVDSALQEIVSSPAGTHHVQLERVAWPPTAAEAVSAILVLPLLVGVVVGYVGLFRLRACGAWLMLVLTVLGTILSPLAGAVAITGWAAMLYDTAMMLNGAILAIVFLGPMRQRFFGAVHPFGRLLIGTQND